MSLISEFASGLSAWEGIDTWISLAGALAAMACALPGAWLLLRKQSLLGDALSHSVLPGIVVAYLGVSFLEDSGWLSSPSSTSSVTAGMSLIAQRQLALFVGAAISAVLAALASEMVQRWGRIEKSAALGVVFTSMFALGLLLIRLFAGRAHLDPDCVLYGNLEMTAFDTLGKTGIPQAVVVNGLMVLIDGLLVFAFYKELLLNSFDPELGAAMGLRPQWISLAISSATAATIVAAFESVGAILVVSMLIIPVAAARLLTDRLSAMIYLSLIIAAVGAVMGHIAALTIPSMVFSRIGMPQVKDASTAGMMSMTTMALFLAALFASPHHGIFRAWFDRMRLRLRIAKEDLLGGLFRIEEAMEAGEVRPEADTAISRSWVRWVARRDLIRQNLISVSPKGDILTEPGAQAARSLVRSHRLWELYMARHFSLPDDHLHATAEQVEHFLGPELQAELAAELDQPTTDPHGKSIPNSES